METLNFVGDLSTEDFRAILRHSLDICALGLFVERQGLPASEHERLFRRRCAPYVVEVREQSEWPGTRLFDSVATVVYFDLNDKVVELLTSDKGSVFDWRWPDMPEDLCLLRMDGSVWFGSISHEHDAWLNVTPLEKEDLLALSPQSWRRLLRGR